jgi:hypothetical protein
MMPEHVGSSVDPSEWQIVGVPPVGIVGECLLTIVVIAVAFAVTWYFSRRASRDIETGRGPLFLYGRK